MTNAHHKLVQDFVAGLSAGALSDDLFTPDMKAWTTISGESDKAAYEDSLKLMWSLFPNGLHYAIRSITAEDDRAAAEVEARGVLSNDDAFTNIYVFLFQFQNGRISSLAEHYNPGPIREKVEPLIENARES